VAKEGGGSSRTGIGERTRLIGLIALLLVAGFAGTSYFAFTASRQALRASIIENELPVTSDTVYSEIQRDLVRPVFISSMMASDTFLRDWVLAGERNPAEMVKFLAEVRSKYGAFTTFFVSERSRRYYQSDRVLKRVDEGEPRDAWYFRVRGMEKDYEINVDPDLAHGDALTVFINYRVLDYEGRFIGAAGIGIEVAAIGSLTDEYRKKYGRSIYFVDGAGDVVAGMPGGMADLPPGSKGLAIQDVEGLSGIAAAILRADRGTFQYERGGKRWLLNVRRVTELGWRLCVEKDDEAALRGVRRALGINLAVLAGITLLVLGIASLTINRYQVRLERTASTDGLTGFLTRPALGLLVGQVFKELRREDRGLCLVMADLDHFKAVNDEKGHGAGDSVLARASSAIRSCLRESDLACRWGGEEFLVVLRSCPLAEGLGVAEKMRQAVAGLEAGSSPGPESQTISVTASFGVAERREEENFDSLLRRADEALYRAKREGRNRVAADPAPGGLRAVSGGDSASRGEGRGSP